MAVSPFSDGTPAAAQWPIPPGYFFDYELHPAVGQAGTYFYHSHVDFQAVSIAGPLIVEDSGKVPYHYDEELVIFLQDVFNLTGTNITAGLQANPFVWSGETTNVMVNGKGQLSGAPQSPSCELASLNVKQDTTYRVRFIGGTGLSFVSLGFEDHSQLTIIEADGQYTQPYTVDYLQVASGQRFSVLFTTKCSDELTKQQYFLQIETRERPTLTRAYAILNYASQSVELPAPATPPLSLPNQTYGWLDYPPHYSSDAPSRQRHHHLGGRSIPLDCKFPQRTISCLPI
jgi:L-ascorbate oxidase